MNILPVFTAPMIASAATALLTFIPVPFIADIGLAGSMALGGYGIAAGRKRDDSTAKRNGFERDVAIRDLKQQLSDVNTHIRKLTKERDRTQDELKNSEAARAGMRDKVSALESQLSKEAAVSPAVDLCEYTAHLKGLNADIEAKDSELAQLKEALEASNAGESVRMAQLKGSTLLTGSARYELEAQAKELEAEVAALKRQCDRLKSDQDKLGSISAESFDELANEKTQTEGKAMNMIDRWKKRALELEQKLAQLQNVPNRFGGIGTADITGNKLIDFLLNEGYKMRAVETDPNPDKGLLVRLEPMEAVDPKLIAALMGKLEVALSLYTLPKVQFKNGRFAFRLAVDPLTNTPDTVTLTSNLDKLLDAIDKARHLAIFGASGSGKSVFLDNAIWAGRVLWPDAKLDLCDPKYPFTEWSSLKPTVKGSEATVDAVINVAETMNKRLAEASAIKDSGEQIPNYARYIFAVDEATVAHTEAKRLDLKDRKGDKLAVSFGSSLGSLLRLGRALNFKGYFLSQSMLVSKVGLNDGDFENATCVYLNSMIDKALNGCLKDLFEGSELSAIRKELGRRRDSGQSYIGLVSDTNTGALFLFESPRPGFYHEQFKAKNDAGTFDPESTFPTVPPKTGNQGKANEANGVSGCADIPHVTASASVPTAFTPIPRTPRAKCPKCSEGSTTLKQKTPLKSGKFRFKCQNDDCSQKTFSALPE